MNDAETEPDTSWLTDPSKSLVPTAKRVPSVDELRDALENAPEAPRKEQNGNSETARPRVARPAGGKGKTGQADPPGHSGGGGKRGDTRARMEIFDDCPVAPLGVRGEYAYYLDVLGQLRAVKKLEAQTIQSLFGHQIPRLCYNFPQWKNTADKGDAPVYERVANRFDQTTASMVMYQAASECGVFNPDNAVRGVGAWKDDDGNLVYHMGDAVLVAGESRKPGRIGKHIYPAAPQIPHPDPSETAPDPVPEVQRALETWNWAVPDVHPHIALGMICVQILGGALDWRPVFWLLAPAAAGKSTLNDLLKLLHGADGLVATTDTTKSGITSKIGQSSLPVAVDELEPGDERSTKERDIIALARVAASGGEWFRGSADQSGVGGKVYSAFLFSSILIPGVMKTQDVQRLIRMELRPIEAGTAKLSLDPRTWRKRGARLKHLLISRWPSWADRLAQWRGSLEVAGVTGRDADNWGTVLAMADMAIQEDIATEDVRASWAKKVAFVAEAGREDTLNDADAMLLHLMGQHYDPFRRGQQYTIAQWVMAAAKLPGAPDALSKPPSDAQGFADLSQRAEEKANAMLASLGLRVRGSGETAHLFIANKQIPQLKELFRNSDWAGGVWAQSAARVPGAEPAPNPLTLAGIRSRGILMPVTSIPGLTYFPMDRAAPDPVVGRSGDYSDVDDLG